MTDKELRKLRRIELLELLVEQGEEMERLRGQLQKAQEALQERTIVIQKAGSLAEAALRLNGVFTAADQAAGTMWTACAPWRPSSAQRWPP